MASPAEVVLQQLECFGPRAGQSGLQDLLHVFAGFASGGRFNREQFWRHSVAVGCCAELLAKTGAGPASPADAFDCGLLHDIGKIALHAALPKAYDRVIATAELLRGDIAEVERAFIGVDHHLAGKRLAERWQLPVHVRECTWLHGNPPQALPESITSPQLITLITLADQLVRQRQIGFSGNYSFPADQRRLAEAVGLKPLDVDEALRDLEQRIDHRLRSLGLARSSASTRQPAPEAEPDAGRGPTIAPEAFAALGGLRDAFHSDASPQDVMLAIATSAASLLESGPMAVFSHPPGQTVAEALVLDPASISTDRLRIECPKPPVPSPQPIALIDADLEWLLAEVSPILRHDRRFWICLEAGNVCIGGIVWGAAADEIDRLGSQSAAVGSISAGWSVALRTAQIREESRLLAEQLAQANRSLQDAQHELLRTGTLITVAEMAAGAAHEMNNPLAVISGRSQLLAAQLSDPKQQQAARLIHEQAERLSGIITELMDFACPTPAAPVASDLANLLKEAIELTKRRHEPADRSFQMDVADVPLITVDPEQVRSALVEVLDNAIQATDPHTGRVLLHARLDALSNRVVLTIADNGCGMDEQTLSRAFDPFFSSKPAGRRRGLGLARALRWIKSSGGSMKLESSAGRETRIVVLLPVAAVTKNEAANRRAAQ